MKTDFIEVPNLPKGDVAIVAASGTYPEIISRLGEMGIEVLQIQPSTYLSRPVCTHADMLCHHLGGNRIVVAKGDKQLVKELKKLNFIVTESSECLHFDYPNDILLNAARVGDVMFAHKMLDQNISEYYKNTDEMQIEYVKQGYAKCSVVVIDSNSIITADKSIAEAARRHGMNALQIAPGHIKLEGYDYGFIGGCCGLIGSHKIAFTGDLHTHPDYLRILNFIESKNVEVVSLTDGELIDIGGILPLDEYISG